ncbi:BRISC and BRCA1-A complex member 2-like [Dendronephthya gigantea]|uniref:BRISC and BRCA1-A complex member 2-like n=1 Tax=Dendronephthya gigantea TaxID=151771 RepID=UPI00106A85D2|nr:BRISC and BRCA1-A complex member 2-like [Dendronephthya gigantea]
MAAPQLSSEINKFALDLYENDEIVTCTDQIRIDKLRRGSNVITQDNCDRFRILIPYGGTTLQWEVLFNSNEPHFPPDIIFGDNEEDFEPNLEQMPSLHYWNPENGNSLTAVVKELLEQYKQYQFELVKNYSQKLEFELESVRQLDTLTSIEVYVHRDTQRLQQQANFLIKLPMDLARLPPFILNEHPGEYSITLFVSYEGQDGSTVTPKIFLSPSVEDAFGDTIIKYPSWNDGDKCLVSYILAVHHYFEGKVDEIIKSYEHRQSYIASFLSHFGTCVLEYDLESFKEISFLMEHDKFTLILTIEIGKDFPEEQPVFKMKSIYNIFNDEPYQAIDDRYPYSPRWSTNEMASRARSYLIAAIPQFKVASIKNRLYNPPGI